MNKKLKAMLSYIMTVTVTASSLVLATGLVQPKTVQAATTSPLVVYSNTNYEANVQSFGVGTYYYNQLTFGNNAISSMKVAPGYKVTVYDGDWLDGDSEIFSTDVADLRQYWMNDRISSIKVEYDSNYADTVAAVAFPNTYYGGLFQNFKVGNYNMTDLKYNDAMSSILVKPGYKITLYAEPNFTGRSLVLTDNNGDLRNVGFNDIVSSIKVEHGDGYVPPATIFQNFSYGGLLQNLDVGTYNVGDLAFGQDQISSLKVQPGYKVTLYGNTNFEGTVQVITSNTENLDSYGINDTTSSLKVEYDPNYSAPVVAYGNDDFAGPIQTFSVGNYNMDKLSFNDAMSAIKIKPGYKVTLYSNENFSGNSLVLNGDNNLEASNFNDVVSSLKVETTDLSNVIDSTSFAVSNINDPSVQADILKKFAPRIYVANNEKYNPSSIEFIEPYMNRVILADTGKPAYYTKEALTSSDTKLPFFAGDLNTAKIYSFWSEKTNNYIDLTYWEYAPYNLGKNILGIEFGNHVGDWEHITVRLNKIVYNGTTYLKPDLVVYPYHTFRRIYQWSFVNKVNDTHVIGYTAEGSHGMYKDSGNHPYNGVLNDSTSAGRAWDTWNSIETYNFNPSTKHGTGIGSSNWPRQFSQDGSYANRPYSIYQWGNADRIVEAISGEALLGAGPESPEATGGMTNVSDSSIY